MTMNLPRKGSRSGTTPKSSKGSQQRNFLPSEEYKLLWTQLQLSYRLKIYKQSNRKLFITVTRTSALLAALVVSKGSHTELVQK